jgi:hypothetical protein
VLIAQLPANESSLFLVPSFNFPQSVEELEGTIESDDSAAVLQKYQN